MSNIKKNLFTAMQDYLMEKMQFNDGLPSLAWTDKDLGQFELMRQGVIVFPLPAVFIKFPDTEFQSLASKDQTGEGYINFSIGMENYLDATYGNPDRMKALDFFTFNERLHKAVNSFTMEGISGIQRVGEHEDDDHANVIVTDLLYKYTLYEEDTTGTTNTSGTIEPRVVQVAPEPPKDIDHGYVLPNSNN